METRPEATPEKAREEKKTGEREARVLEAVRRFRKLGQARALEKRELRYGPTGKRPDTDRFKRVQQARAKELGVPLHVLRDRARSAWNELRTPEEKREVLGQLKSEPAREAARSAGREQNRLANSTKKAAAFSADALRRDTEKKEAATERRVSRLIETAEALSKSQRAASREMALASGVGYDSEKRDNLTEKRLTRLAASRVIGKEGATEAEQRREFLEARAEVAALGGPEALRIAMERSGPARAQVKRAEREEKEAARSLERQKRAVAEREGPPREAPLRERRKEKAERAREIVGDLQAHKAARDLASQLRAERESKPAGSRERRELGGQIQAVGDELRSLDDPKVLKRTLHREAVEYEKENPGRSYVSDISSELEASEPEVTEPEVTEDIEKDLRTYVEEGKRLAGRGPGRWRASEPERRRRKKTRQAERERERAEEREREAELRELEAELKGGNEPEMELSL